MKHKQKAGIVVLVIGIALFIFSQYAQGKIGNAKHEVSETSSLFSGNMVGNAVGNAMMGRASKYDTIVMLSKIGGIALFVIGAGMIFFYRKK